MSNREIPYYQDYLSDELFQKLKKESRAVAGVAGLTEVGSSGGLETKEALQFLCELYDQTKDRLNKVLSQRKTDRDFIDLRTEACFQLNQNLKIGLLDPDYHTLIGQEDAHGRIVVGPKNEFYSRRGYGKPIAPIPDYLSGNHVTLFGPPDDAKLSINAMNAFHRKIKNEPAIISELLADYKHTPKWGADDEDSKTPLRQDLIHAGEHLTDCFEKTLSYTDPTTQKTYHLNDSQLSLPIKRFPGLALPCLFLFYRDNPLPLHLYDFALHLFRNWRNPTALSFYVPKLENEEEAAYIHHMIETAEKLLNQKHSEYKVGSIRLFIVLENPRAIFRVNEIMDALYPYFAGASLGWHDYLASTARLFKNDANYRIPVKADPQIVIKYIKASHDLLAEVVGSRGGIKIGGMYGILPMQNDLQSESFQVTMKGFIKDVVTQMKRNLTGFWVAHPDFVRIGLAMVEAWKLYAKDPSKLETLVTSLLIPRYHKEILDFIRAKDIQGLDPASPLYPRSLLVADIQESDFIHNNDPEEIRYNVFQSLQYLTDWLCGNGCVALPAQVEGVAVRVMDDLATAERSRWEVWHEIHHGRVSIENFLKIAHEELLFIRKDYSNDKKIVQVKWDERTAKWYPIAMRLMIQLMTAPKPVEFATELLLPFTVESIRNASDPWAALQSIDAKKYSLEPFIERFHEYFSACGSLRFASKMAHNTCVDFEQAEHIIQSFSIAEIIESASFHGNIGESKKSLDEVASKEQALVIQEDEARKKTLRDLGEQYLKKFGFKYLISAQGKSADEISANLTTRLQNSRDQEIANARAALWEITKKRLANHPFLHLQTKIQNALKKHGVHAAQISISNSAAPAQTLAFGANPKTWFELASLSKTMASCFAIEYFKKKNIPLSTKVNSLFAQTPSPYRIPDGDEVQLEQLMKHSALNMHYVEGYPANQAMPKIQDLLAPIRVHQQPPGSAFQYSGGGFLVLEHLIESFEKKSIQEITRSFFKELGTSNLSFEQKTLPGIEYAAGYLDSGTAVEGTRKMFPAFAAGAMGTAADYHKFLKHLEHAYHNTQGSGPISHDTAIQMLASTDRSSQEFMGVNLGIGVFIAEAGANRFAIHQGANDGFRCLSAHCYAGPNRGQGFVILCNADNKGVSFVAEVAQAILEELKPEGVNVDLFKSQFDMAQIPQEEIVNFGYKKLVFGAFEADLPEAILNKGPLDPLASYNLAVGATIVDVTNQRFARAENLISNHLPIFDPELYGLQGKTMDSWESVRHNFKPSDDPCDRLVLRLKKPSTIRYVSLSTQFHLGNHPQFVKIEVKKNNELTTLLEKTFLEGHALKRIDLEKKIELCEFIRVSMYPDGGLSRLGLYEDLPANEKEKFLPIADAKCVSFKEAIPHAKKPLTPKYSITPEKIEQNWKRVPKGAEVDVASMAYGGTIVNASNEHYGPAVQILSPYPPLNMFDGLESARSRIKGHFEHVTVAFAKPSLVHRIEIDFTFFKNNNPFELSIEGIVPRTLVKPYAGNKIEFKIDPPKELNQIKITVHPDGGFNRLHVYSKKS